MAHRYYIGPWVLDNDGADDFWRAPTGTVGMVDLRSLADQGTYASGNTVGFFATDGTVLGADYTELGTALDDALRPASVSALKSLLKLDALDADHLLDALWEVLTYRGDPEGGVRAKPILPTRLGVLELWLGGHSLVRSRRFAGEPDAAWPVVQKVLQEDYRKVREAALSPDSKDPTVHQRLLSTYSDKYGIEDVTKFIPSDLPNEEGLQPHTSLGDTFVDDNGTGLDAHTPTPSGGFSWVEIEDGWTIESNQLNVNNKTDIHARANQALSSDDHYHASDLQNVQSTDFTMFCIARQDHSGAETFYGVRYTHDNTRSELFKRVAGSFTSLDTDITDQTGTVNYKLICDGSSITGDVDSVELLSATDSAITGNLMCGYRSSTNAIHTADNFVAADLAAAGFVPYPFSRGARGGLHVLSGGLH